LIAAACCKKPWFDPPPRPGDATKPFDLVWDVAHQDYNGVPINPYWGAQLSQAAPPSFTQLCSGSVSNGVTIVPSVMANCTSQLPALDVFTMLPPPLCGPDPIRGHLNWFEGTFTGRVAWVELAGDDGDYNLSLTTDKGAKGPALTDENKGALGLELLGTEVGDYVGSSWWKALDTAALHNQADAKTMLGGANGLVGVVTGLVGLDGVHGAYTELHPVHIMALRLSQQAVAGGVLERWAFLARNSGIEGMCSNYVHYWDGAHVPPMSSHHYFVQLPWPAGASGAQVTIQEWASWEGAEAAVTYSLSPPNQLAPGAVGLTLIQVDLPTEEKPHGADGLVQVMYPGAQVDPPSAAAVPSGHDPEPELEDGLVSVQPDPQKRAQLAAALKQALAPTTKPAPAKMFLAPTTPQVPGPAPIPPASRAGGGAAPANLPPERGTSVADDAKTKALGAVLQQFGIH
jgi:hypothetical protein